MKLFLSEWHRAVAHVDMQSFFASIEQLDFPYLQGRPVVVTNGHLGTTIITSSYEAREYGIKTGWKLKDAQAVCPLVVRRASRPERYAEVSSNIMESLKTITPCIEVFSVDEAFLDLKPVLHLYKSIEEIAQKIRSVVFKASGGLRCSIGISEGKLTAKYCAKLDKGSTTIIKPSAIKEAMSLASVGDICGIGKRIETYLNKRGIYYCRDLEKFPQAILASRFGDIGRRLYMSCLGYDPYPVVENDHEVPKSMGHSKVLPPKTRHKELIYAVMTNLCERLAKRLRTHGFLCQIYSVGFKSDLGWVGEKVKVNKLINDSRTVLLIGKDFLDKNWHDQALYYLSINALKLEKPTSQLTLFDEDLNLDEKQTKLDQIKDQINDRFGRGSVKLAIELQSEKANMISVISPAWRPKGAKRSV